MNDIKVVLYTILMLLGAMSEVYAATPTTPALTVDPRAYGSICGGFNIFSGNGTTTVFNYTIPFTGSSSTDNSKFFVFYELNNGSGTATILNSSQFSVTGVNTGVGGTITLNSPVPSGSTLVVAHDDAAGLISASTVSVAIGGATIVPDNCTIYGSQTLGTQLAEGAQLVGQNSTPNYLFQGQPVGPTVRIIAPAGAPPAFGFNVSGKNQQSFTGLTVTTNVPGNNSLGFLSVPVLIGANGASGAGGGESPGIVLDHMTLNSGIVCFGAPQGGNSAYIFAALHKSNFSACTAGTWGPLSDLVADGNDFVANGAFGSYGSAGGMVIGPQEGAVGAAGASRVWNNRFEFNKEGVVILAGGLINLGANQYDGNAGCGLDLNTFWSNITSTGEWFRGNANGGGAFQGNTTAGQDAHICFNGTNSASGGFHAYNDVFLTNYGNGNVNPPGSNNATSPFYVLDFNGTAANNNDVEIQGGEGQIVAGNQGAAVTDFAVYRNGRPSILKIDINGQTTQGKIANGSFPSQALGLPANSWSAYTVVGEIASHNYDYIPLTNGYAALVGKNIGLPPTYKIIDNFSSYDCDVVNSQIAGVINPSLTGNPVITWLPSPNDPTFGGGFFAAHLADTDTCRTGGIAWMAIPQSFKLYAQGSAFASTGSWSNSSLYGGAYGITSSTHGDTTVITFTGTGKAAYFLYAMNGNNGGTFTWQLDSGVVSANVATQGNNAFTFPIDNTKFTLGGIRIPVNSTGTHTLTITVTSATSGSNTVTPIALATPSGTPQAGTVPTVFLGGQAYYINSGGYAAANAAFNAEEMQLANQFFADGVPVSFANVLQYFNFSTDILTGTSNFNSLGQTHIAKAFSDAMQGGWNAGNVVNPLNYGASCNSLFFSDAYTNSGFVTYGVSTTASSNVISINNYHFQSGTATQTGGGDVGKRICIFGRTALDVGPCTYIASVDAGANTATLGANMLGTGNDGWATMGGFPTNPNDPSTAQDDTIPIQNGGNAAQLGGGKLFLPSNCLVHDLTLPQNIEFAGNSPGDFYLQTGQDPGANPQVTVLNCGITGYPSDTQQCIQTVPHVRMKDFMIRAPTFPYTPFGISGACIGYSTNSNSGPNSQILTENISYFGCPVSVGIAYGFNHPVTFNASISGNHMTVSAITSSTFVAADNWNTIGGGGTGLDFLAKGRPVTGAGVPANTTILLAARNGGAGVYTLSTSSTVSSESMTSAASTQGMELRDRHSQHTVDAIAYNGDFSDSTIDGSTCTGTFMNGCWRLGPALAGYGNAGNRWIGGRMEEVGSTVNSVVQAAITCDGCELVTTGLDFDFNGGYNVRTLGSFANMQITGGAMQAGGHCAGGHNAMIRVGGSNSNIAVDGVYLESEDDGSGCGGTTNYLFSTEVGATPQSLSVTGGNAPVNALSITNMYDWTNGTPVKYKQNVANWPLIDTSQTVDSTSFTGQKGFGTANVDPSSKLDVVSTTQGARSCPSMTTTQKNAISSPAEGLCVYDATLHLLYFYNGSVWTALTR